MYGQMLKIIRKSKKRTVVMWNRYCASACEEFAMKVSDFKHVTTMGENSNGTFAYGMIKGLTTPACRMRFIITTERYRDRLQYEKVGFPPLIALTASDDWMEQAYRVVGE